MARGAKESVEKLAQGTYNTAGTAATTAASQGGSAYSALMPQVMQMLTPSGDPAVTAATMGAAQSKFGEKEQAARDAATRTNNGASTNAVLDKLALDEGSTVAQTAANNVAQQHGAATKLLAQIYGMNEEDVAKLLGVQNESVKAYTGGAKEGSGLGGLGAIAGALGGAFG